MVQGKDFQSRSGPVIVRKKTPISFRRHMQPQTQSFSSVSNAASGCRKLGHLDDHGSWRVSQSRSGTVIVHQKSSVSFPTPFEPVGSSI